MPEKRTCCGIDDDAGQEIGGPDEIGDERAGRLAIDLGGRADLLDHALVHHDDPIGHRQRLFLIVRDHDRRDAEALVQAADLAAQVRAHARIERGERLVEQQQAGRERQRARDGNALLLAAGELRRILAPGFGQSDEAQQLVDARADLDFRQPRLTSP